MTRWHVALVRWALFISAGLPVQVFIYLIYPLFYLYFRFKVVPYRQRFGHDFNYEPPLYTVPIGDTEKYYRTRNHGAFLDNLDPHNALTHWALWSVSDSGTFGKSKGTFGMSLLSSTNSQTVYRLCDENKLVVADDVSGDCLVSWCFAFTQLQFGERRLLEEHVLSVASGYLKYLGCLSLGGESRGWVSNRCNNFGINYCPDDFPIGQPAGGPQFYTSNAIFALAAKVGGFKWKLVYWLHWIIMGGWYWAWWPFICVRNNGLGYVRDITMKALYVDKWCVGPKWWNKIPMDELTYVVSECRNEFFMALQGRELRRLPEILDPWMFQQTDAKAPSKLSDDANGYLAKAMQKLAGQAKELNKRKSGW